MKQLSMVSIGGLILMSGMVSSIALGASNANELHDEASRVGLPDPTIVRKDEVVTVDMIRTRLRGNCNANSDCAASLAADKDYARGSIPAYDPNTAPSIMDIKRKHYGK
ncbi:MAG: hypothetical protein ACYC2E_14035 [Sulfuricella sp.]